VFMQDSALCRGSPLWHLSPGAQLGNNGFQLASPHLYTADVQQISIPCTGILRDAESDPAVDVKSDRIRSKVGLWWKVS